MEARRRPLSKQLENGDAKASRGIHTESAMPRDGFH
jgi:hypothetical protein